MKFAIKSIVAAAAFVAAGMANAAIINVPTDGSTITSGVTVTGSGALSFHVDLLAALDVGQVEVTGYGAATSTVVKDVDGFYTEATASAPMTSLMMDTATGIIQSAATTGGATQTSPAIKKISTGGTLTVTDLNVDMANKKVFATIIGANGVGTLNNFYLWDIATITGATTFAGAGTYNTKLSGLSITTAGFNTFVQALGLLTTGKNALAGVTDYGVINSTIIAKAVPEPSTYALMALGLVGMAVVARRRAK